MPYGSLFAGLSWVAVKLLRKNGEVVEEGLKPFRFYGPTCDSVDHMPGPFYLPESVDEGDYIEIGMLGAYGVAMSTRFNGFGENETAEVQDAPMASMYGLAKRSIPTHKPESEERKVVRFSRPKGAAGKVGAVLQTRASFEARRWLAPKASRDARRGRGAKSSLSAGENLS